MYFHHPKCITLGPQVNVRLQKVFEVSISIVSLPGQARLRVLKL